MGVPGAVLPGIEPGIGPLFVSDGPFGPVVFAASGRSGGLVMLSVAPTGAQILSQRLFEPAVQGAVDGRLILLETPDGPLIVFGSDGDDTLVGYRVTSAGLGETAFLSAPELGRAANVPGGATIAQDSTGALFTAAPGTLRAYDFDDMSALVSLGSISDSGGTGLSQPTVLTTAQVGASRYVLVAGRNEVGVTALRVDESTGQPQFSASIGPADGLGLFPVPTGLEVIEHAGRSFVIVTTAPETGSGAALSVLALSETGDLTVTDHILDSQLTRFGSVTGLSAVSHDGWVYIAAAGGDGGVSLFSLLPGGRLVHLDTLISAVGADLSSVNDLALAVAGDRLILLMSASGLPGLTELSVDLSDQGVVLPGTAGADQIQGGALNDMLEGGAGDDRLTGDLGDDILSDGSGSDTLTGSAGSDLFVLAADAARDEITDFEAGLDRLDLSAWSFLYEPSQLTVSPQAWGGRITYRTETLDIYSASGTPLSFAQVAAAFEQSFDRPPLALVGDEQGSEAPQSLFGTDISDTITAGDGADTVDAGLGQDLVFLQGGADRFLDVPETGPDGSDTVFGGAGDDTIAGGGGDDLFDGEEGSDLIYGGNGNDTIRGGAGNDGILSGAGNDSVEGDAGNDWVSMEDGNDFFRDDSEFGAGGQDTVFGGAGNDTIAGWGGNDRFDGEAGDDLIYGGFGRDVVTGGTGRDWIDLGSGDDTFVDTDETGVNGRDTITGGAGADTFVFRDIVAQEVITDFETGIDTLQLTSTLVEGRSAQQVIDDFASVLVDGVLLTFGSGQTIFLQGVTSTLSLATDISVSDDPIE